MSRVSILDLLLLIHDNNLKIRYSIQIKIFGKEILILLQYLKAQRRGLLDSKMRGNRSNKIVNKCSVTIVTMGTQMYIIAPPRVCPFN